MKNTKLVMNCAAHPAWGFAAALMIAGLTLVGATRAQEVKANKVNDALKPESADNVQKNPTALDKTDQKEQSGWGRFMSFQDGTLTLKGNSGELVWQNVTEKTTVMRWDDAAHQYLPAGTVAVLSKVERGSWVFVAANMARIQVGAGKESHVTGTFVSFKNDRLLMQGNDLGNYAQNHGTQLHFNKFAENVPVYQSVAGGAYKLVGAAEMILPNVTEGIPITVYGEGDFNFTRIEIGVPKKK